MTTTEGLTEDAYTTAVEAAVDLVRAKHPDLDLRAGTAIRSLVIEPAALLDATQRGTVNRLRTALSLEAMSRETTVPREDAEAVLSNFGITLGGGTKASGVVRVNVNGTSPVTVRAGITFKTEDGVEFVVTETTYAATDPADGEAEILSSSDGRYYFIVPVEAVEVGTSGNIEQGKSLTVSAVIGNYLSSEAFSDFSGGEDGETVASAVARIPSALAYRGMTNEISVRAQLAASMVDPATLRAVSCVGHRNRSQLRDKHNPLGIAVGGRVDVYARLFDAPGVTSFIAEGTLIQASDSLDGGLVSTVSGVGTYRIPLPRLPGFYAVKYVGSATQPNHQGSLQYKLVRATVDGATDDHDFDVSSDHCETAWSKYQDGRIIVYDSSDYAGVNDYEDTTHDTSTVSTARPTKMSFKVDVFWTDGIADMQDLVDRSDVRNVAADYVVRSPAICLVNMHASVRMKSGVSVSMSDLESYVAAYVNGRSFVGRITRSELANVLLQHGVESVDMSTGGMYLGGRICGADGEWYYLDGDTLDVSSVGPERAMLGTGTVVFAAEAGSIQITAA